MKTDELREAFLDFFASKGCVRKPSDTLVPHGDETVLFTPAGMNQFKREFMGLGDPNFKRAVTCQKCLRTGDIENVGKTPRHMTFFEMLGNFSFGDYFKREAIQWGWEFLTKTLKIDRNRLTITVYLDDDEAYDIWHQEVGLPADRITRMGEDDNFWPAGAPTHGPNGVCGPCSEIFYHGDGIEEVEIWNLVFTQFNRVGPGQLEPLPKKNIDTGMGLERTAAALQGVRSNFEIDLFQPIVRATADVLGIDYARIKDTLDGVRIRRASDHARALTFCIHENVRPSAEKQGYVLRRLLRRAVLDAYQMGQREPYLYQVVPAVADAMKGGYPELIDSVPRIQNVVREEEERFLRNLENGMSLLADTFKKTKSAGSDVIDGAAAFDLLSTYGIPVEVTEGLAADQNLRVDRAGFEKAREKFAAVSRGTTEAADVFATGPLDTLKEAYHHGSEFVGYRTCSTESRVIGIIEQGQLAESATAAEGGPPVVLVLDRTPFYGESGGQVGDYGIDRGGRIHVRGRGHEEGSRFHVASREGEGGDRHTGGDGSGRGGRAASASDPAGPLRDARAASRVAHSSGEARAAGGQQGGARSVAVRLREPGGGRSGADQADRGDGQRAHPAGRGGELDDHADRGGAEAGGDGPLRGEVSGGRAGRLDGRVLTRTLRGDAPGERRADRPVQDRGRGIGVGRHAGGSRR